MSELKPCPFCEAGLLSGINVRKKSVMRHPYNPKCPLSEVNFLDTPGFRESWNRRAEPANAPISADVEQAINELSKAIGSDCLLEYPSDVALKTAVYALRGLCEPDNVPLTLDELRKMEGQPIWIEVLDRPDLSRWHFIVKHPKMGLIAKDGLGQYECHPHNADQMVFSGCYFDIEHGHNYGVNWLAYRRKPEVHIGVDLASGEDFTGYTDGVGKHIMQRFTRRE